MALTLARLGGCGWRAVGGGHTRSHCGGGGEGRRARQQSPDHTESRAKERAQTPGNNKMPGGNVAYQGSALKATPRQLNKAVGVKKASEATAPVRLWVKGVFVSYTGGKKNTYHHTAIVKLQDLNDKDDVPFYLGKKLAYIYKVKKADKFGSKFRVIWGKVCRAHGNNGAVRAKFTSNLPPKALGKPVRCFLYPSHV